MHCVPANHQLCADVFTKGLELCLQLRDGLQNPGMHCVRPGKVPRQFNGKVCLLWIVAELLHTAQWLHRCKPTHLYYVKFSMVRVPLSPVRHITDLRFYKAESGRLA